VDLEHAGHLASGSALLEQPLRQRNLLGSQLGWPAEAHTAPRGQLPYIVDGEHRVGESYGRNWVIAL